VNGKEDETSPATPQAEGPRPIPGSLDRAVEMVHFLRARCPWDARQTPRTLIPYLLEEAHETAEAIRREESAQLEGELGDLLLNLAFQIAIGEERGDFHRESVTARMEEKMRRRHPHLFGRGEAETWEAVKAREREVEGGGEGEPESILAGVPTGLDPLLEAHRIQGKVSGVGFDWSDPLGAWEKVAEEVAEVREAMGDSHAAALEEEVGDLLFSVVNLARLLGVHPGTALQGANGKFRRRFRAVEAAARERGVVLHEAGLEALDRLWDEVKAREGGGAQGGGPGVGPETGGQ